MKKKQRIFVPGDQWLYLKLYTSHKTADKILIEVIAQLVHEFRKLELIDNWFFIRYYDPNFHLRIRFHLLEPNKTGVVMAIINKKIKKKLQSHLVWNLQYDTYNRELERYGGVLIEEAETLFGLNSDLTIELMQKIIILSDENYRWQIALRIMDSLISAFVLTDLEKICFVDKYSHILKEEFGFDKYNSKAFNTLYRKHKEQIEIALNDKSIDVNFSLLHLIVKKYHQQILLIAKKISSALNKRKDIDILITNYVHMDLNRLFYFQNRKYELILYDFLYRYYTSELARIKYNK